MEKLTRSLFKLLLALVFIAYSNIADAHAPDQSYIYVDIHKDKMGGRFEATAKDLNRSIGLNIPDPIQMKDLEPHLEKIYAYLKSKSSFSANGQTFDIKFSEVEILPLNELDDFAYFYFTLEGFEEVPDAMDIKYECFFDTDPIHRGMFIVEYNWKAGVINNESFISLVFSPDNTQQQLSLTDLSLWKGFVALVKLGIWHIWIGLDHILFIVALILPSVVRRRASLKDESLVDTNVTAAYSNSWLPVAKFKPAFIYIISIVTFFTIAHSITLALASLQIINLPSRFVESIIAISIALAALHNITPIFKGREWLIAFLFGLFHGFGFASVLGEKGISGDYLVLSLLGFNVGVEIGQVLIICMVFPVLFLIRKLNIYPKIVTYGSVLLILISLYWFIERALDVELAIGRYIGL